jgi:hypothetical protein
MKLVDLYIDGYWILVDIAAMAESCPLILKYFQNCFNLNLKII